MRFFKAEKYIYGNDIGLKVEDHTGKTIRLHLCIFLVTAPIGFGCS